MKVIHYTVTVRAKKQFHIHAPNYARTLYVPEEDVALFAVVRGIFGGTEYGLVTHEERLDHARAIAKGEDASNDEVVYGDVHEFEYDGDKLRSLIKDARSKKDARLKAGIDDLIAQASL